MSGPREAWEPPPGVTLALVDGSMDGPFLVARLVLEPGARVPDDAHQEHFETIHVLGGNVAVTAGKSAFWLDARSRALGISPGERHEIVAGILGAEILSVLQRVST